MKKLFDLILCLICLSVPGFSQTVAPTQEVLFPHFAVGGGWEADLTIVAQGAENSSGSILFFAQDGSIMTVTVDGQARFGQVDYNMMYRSCRTFRLTGGSQTKVGWILVSQLVSDSQTKGSINCILSFRYRIGGSVLSQVGVPGARQVMNTHLPFNNTQGNLSSFAIMTLESNMLEIRQYDEIGNLKDIEYVALGDFSQTALFVHEMFPGSINKAGFLTISGTKPFGTLAMNVNDSKWSSSAGFPAVLERQIDVIGTPPFTTRIILEGQFIYGLVEMSPGVPNPLTGYIAIPPFGELILNINITTYLVTTGEAIVIVCIARTTDWNLLDVTGDSTIIYEDGTFEAGGSFHLYAPSNAQF